MAFAGDRAKVVDTLMPVWAIAATIALAPFSAFAVETDERRTAAIPFSEALAGVLTETAVAEHARTAIPVAFTLAGPDALARIAEPRRTAAIPVVVTAFPDANAVVTESTVATIPIFNTLLPPAAHAVDALSFWAVPIAFTLWLVVAFSVGSAVPGRTAAIPVVKTTLPLAVPADTESAIALGIRSAITRPIADSVVAVVRPFAAIPVLEAIADFNAEPIVARRAGRAVAVVATLDVFTTGSVFADESARTISVRLTTRIYTSVVFAGQARRALPVAATTGRAALVDADLAVAAIVVSATLNHLAAGSVETGLSSGTVAVGPTGVVGHAHTVDATVA